MQIVIYILIPILFLMFAMPFLLSGQYYIS